ncbi:unnamed protein product, partial [Meganyctiphanes norvegica]
MKAVIILSVVCATQCAAVLKDLPANTRLEYEHDNRGRLTEIDIDYNNPTPAPRTVASPAGPTFEYEYDNRGRLTEIDIDYNKPTPAPRTATAPAGPTYEYDHDNQGRLVEVEIDYNDHSHQVVPKNNQVTADIPQILQYSASPVAKPAHETAAAPAPAVTADTFSAPLIIQGPKVVLRQEPGALQVITKGPEVVYNLPVAFAPMASAATVKTHSVPVVTPVAKSAPAPATSPLIGTFYTIDDDGEVAEVFRGHIRTFNNLYFILFIDYIKNTLQNG